MNATKRCDSKGDPQTHWRNAGTPGIVAVVALAGAMVGLAPSALAQPERQGRRPHAHEGDHARGHVGVHSDDGRPCSDEGTIDLTRAQTLDRLSLPLDIDFEGQSLHDVVRYLALVTEVPLDPLWQDGLRQVGLDPMLSITLESRGRSALECLELILGHASEAQRFDTGATWQFSPTGTIEFGPRERLNRPVALRAEVYDVADLLTAMQVPGVAPRLIPNQAIIGGTGPWVFPGDREASPESGGVEAQSPTDQLIDVITTTVEPEQWVVNGGEVGIIRIVDGALIVLAPDYVHRGLAGPLSGHANEIQSDSD